MPFWAGRRRGGASHLAREDAVLGASTDGGNEGVARRDMAVRAYLPRLLRKSSRQGGVADRCRYPQGGRIVAVYVLHVLPCLRSSRFLPRQLPLADCRICRRVEGSAPGRDMG